LMIEADPDAPGPSRQPTVEDFEKVLRTVTYSNPLDSPDATPRVVEFQAFGDEDQFGQQQAGNVAIATVTIESTVPAALSVAAVVSEENAPASPAIAAPASFFYLSSSATEALEAKGATSEAVSAAAVDAVMDALQPDVAGTAPAEPLLPDDLLATLAFFLQEAGEEEEEPLLAGTPPIDPEALLQ
jgi:hypothetical protein